ncbi:MAG: hypothetical protein PHG87_01460 [Candidatus Omnitrophica bacterium]|nr:hypothetical protein [Candidatus Omnitrophota bacterium]
MAMKRLADRTSEDWKEAEKIAKLWQLEVENPQLFEALQDPFARFVGLTVYRVRKILRLVTFGRCCKI